MTAAMIGRSVVGSSSRTGPCTGADGPGTWPLTVVVIPHLLDPGPVTARSLPMESGTRRQRRHLVSPLQRPAPQSVIRLPFGDEAFRAEIGGDERRCAG